MKNSSSSSKSKSINSLMKHLRGKGINISGSKNKRDLQNIGYYHGYKGYRFCKYSNMTIQYSDFDQLKAVYDFDMKLKAWFYPHIMFIETALKNRVLQATLDNSDNCDFTTIFVQALNAHLDQTVGTESYKRALKDRLDLRKQIYSDISQNISSPIVQHFYNNNKMVPLWGIFEFLTLGEFGKFYDCLNRKIKLIICETLDIPKGINTNGALLGYMIFTMKDLRNAIAHNSPVFDVRFNDQSRRSYRIPKLLNTYLMQIYNLPMPNPYYGRNTQVDFQQIIDYFLLIIYLLKALDTSKTEIRKQISEFETIFLDFSKAVPDTIYKKIVQNDISFKLQFARNFI